MGIPLEQEKDVAPGVKFQKTGQWVEIAMVSLERIPWTEFGTERPKLGKDGRPRQQERIMGFAVGGTALVGARGEESSVTHGRLVAVYLKGSAWWDALQARDEFRKVHGRLEVGDLVHMELKGTVPSQVPGGSPRKVYAFSYTKSTDDMQKHLCEQRHAEMRESSREDEDYDILPDEE